MTPINGAFPLMQPQALGEMNRATTVREATGGEGAFGAVLEQALVNANTQANAAQSAAEAFAAGSRDDIHGTMLALSKADIELKVVGNVRNKIVDAFYELWRMQV
jgi:flagellar hook-basal body complex protein FliE